MNKYAFIAESGDIKYIIHSNDYADGDVWNYLLVKAFDTSLSDSQFLERKYYRDGQFLDKPEKPNGSYRWEGYQWVLDVEALQFGIRAKRNALLRDTDWTQMPDAPLTEQQRTAWAIYRQSLRDVPQNNLNAESIDDIIWPTKPE